MFHLGNLTRMHCFKIGYLPKEKACTKWSNWAMFIKTTIVFKLFNMLFFVFWVQASSAQENFLKEEEDAWIPAMLETRNTAFFRLLQFNGYGIGWKYHGFENASTLVLNGMEWNNKKLGIDLNAAMLGVYPLTRTEKTSTGYEPSEHGLAATPVMRYLNMQASDFPKQIKLSNRFLPLRGSFQTSLIWSTGRIQKSWHFQFKWQAEQNFYQDPALGKKTLNGFAFSVEKSFSKQGYFSVGFWYNQLYQTKQSPTVLEAVQLSGNRMYHPGWGWYKGQLVFPNAKNSNLPFVQLHYRKIIHPKQRFQILAGFAKGNQSIDGMDWTSTKDPRPDYYKYLPSYYKDSTLKDQLRKQFMENPASLQLNFDAMKKINESGLDKRSFYMLSRENAKILIAQEAIHYYIDWTERMQWSFHASTLYERIEKYNTIIDLLGGDYFLNYNSWVSDEDAHVFQFDMIRPDRKIKVNDTWGAHYSIQNLDHQLSALFFWQSPKMESSIGLGYGMKYFRREGFNQNGLFPNNSLGKSDWLYFPEQKIQWQILYKHSPRWFVKFNSIFHQESPSWNEAFKNLTMQNQLTDYLLPITHLGVHLSAYYLGIRYTSSLQVYGYSQKNQSGKTSFYHDYYNQFVQANFGLLNTRKMGVEWSFETLFPSFLNYQIGLGWGTYTIQNNPIYSIQSLGTDYPLESGNLHLFGLSDISTPEMIIAFGVNGQLSSSIRLGLSSLLGYHRKMEIDYFRRSFLWEKKMLPSNEMPKAFLTNCYIQKTISFKIKSVQHRLLGIVQLQNIFNQSFPVFAFEQSRYDYKNLDALKFAPKYLQSFPFNGAIQIIYQIN